MNGLLQEIRGCHVCSPFFLHNPRPVVRASSTSKLLIIGQAPGRKVHESGIPWDDRSGLNLREWLGIDEQCFYDTTKVALVPMGFCYPGSGKSGDLPPRSECAPLWHDRVLKQLEHVQLTLLIGRYAQNYYLKEQVKATLTETVRAYEEYLPQYLPLPHPSPRNRIWLKRNEWFEKDLIPILKDRIANLF